MRAAAKDGTLDHDTRVWVIQSLRLREGPLYELIDIAGWMAMSLGPSQEEINAIAPFLDYRIDTMIPGLALTVLVGRWGLGRNYSDRILEFLDGPKWDLEGSAKLAAATVAGQLLESCTDPALLRKMLKIVEDSDELSGTREAAYFGLARAKGIGVTEQVRLGMRLPSTSLDADEVVEWARHHSRQS
jgi:hypothetical protein